MKSSISGEIREFINREILGNQGGDLTETTPLLALGILDSFALIALVSFLSERYRISLDLATIDPGDLETIGAIADLVVRSQVQV